MKGSGDGADADKDVLAGGAAGSRDKLHRLRVVEQRLALAIISLRAVVVRIDREVDWRLWIGNVPDVDVAAALATAEEVPATTRLANGEALGLGALVIRALFFALVTGLSIELVLSPAGVESLLRDLCVRVPHERHGRRVSVLPNGKGASSVAHNLVIDDAIDGLRGGGSAAAVVALGGGHLEPAELRFGLDGGGVGEDGRIECEIPHAVLIERALSLIVGLGASILFALDGGLLTRKAARLVDGIGVIMLALLRKVLMPAAQCRAFVAARNDAVLSVVLGVALVGGDEVCV